jgi:predicted outer membrane repeat protein
MTLDGGATFTSNSAGYDGGGIFNLGTMTLDGGATFTSNSADSYGGGIYNENSSFLTLSGGSSFTSNSAGYSAGGIYNFGTMTLDGGATFTSNSAGEYGGGIFNEHTSFLTLSGGSSFTSNSATWVGGGIYNYGTMTLDGGATFTSNSAGVSGGAVYNSGGTTTLTGDSTFTTNTATSGSGGAINNIGSSSLSITGATTFTSNTAFLNGGAINNLNSTLNLTGNTTFTGNSSSTGSGGAIFNDPGTVLITGDGTFNNNTAALNGGAIANVISSIFSITGNGTFGNNRSTTGSGGAITTEDNSHTTINAYGSFTNNTAAVNGGAVNVDNSSFNVFNGAIFSGNVATSGSGGAIYLNNNATATLVANTQNVTFTGNTANGVNNGVGFGSNSTLNANASYGGGEVIFLDKITSSGGNNVIHLNRTGTWNTTASPNTPTGNGVPTSAPTNGNIRLNADMSGFSGSSNTVNLYGGSLNLGAAGTFFNNINFNASNNATLNLINNKIDTIALNNASVDNLNLHVDIDLANKLVDNINATSMGANDTVIIKSINLWNDGDSGMVFVNNSYQLKLTVDPAAQQVTGPVHIYNVMVPEQTVPGGTATPFANSALLLLRTNEVNPLVRSAPTVNKGVQLGILDNTRMVMNRSDEVMSFMDTILYQTGVDYDKVNKVALLEGFPEYNAMYDRLERGGIWYRPFSSFEKVAFSNLNGRINSTGYGMLVGYDSALKRRAFGFKNMTTYYAGYNGSNQGFQNVNNTITGGFAGIMETLYKGNFYLSAMAQGGGASVRERLANYGASSYGMANGSFSVKTGYNIHLPLQSVLQLHGQAVYTLLQSSTYTNGQGVRIQPDLVTSLQIAPGVRLTKNIKGWQPYVEANWVMNPYHSAKMKANDFAFSNPALGDYFEYGFGVQKTTQHDVQTYAQAMMRTGSRTGVALELGIKIPIGQK